MPTYVALCRYTEKGLQGVKDSPTRLDAARRMLEEMGGRLDQFFMTLGEYDLVFTYEAPDDACAARFILQLGSLGNVRTTSMKAFPERAYRELLASLA
jgi:uncharacterized protein with GYD domain